MEQEQSPDTPASTAVENYPVVEEQSPDTPASTGVKTDLDQVAVAAQKDASDSVKRSASPKSDARGVSMEVDNDSRYITLYNEAINKIFKDYIIYTSVHNPKHFKSPNSSSKSATDTCREQFLSFMSNNFQKFNNMDLVQGKPFLDIVEKVRQFIKLMEVDMTGTDTDSQIVVTLHDIKTKYSFYDTDHCISEKLFMAILLAIKILHCPTPSDEREYTLKFKFAPSLFGKSSLQQSSIKCTNNSVMSNLKSNYDPVAANIFNFDLTRLKPDSKQSSFHDSNNDSNISDLAALLGPTQAGGSKSRRRHRRHHKSKHVRKTRRGRGRKSKPKPKTHRRRSARHSRIRKHKKYTSRVG